MTLRELNFRDLIKLDVDDVNQYEYKDYAANNNHHKPIIGYCTKCEEMGISTCNDEEEGYCLRNISHGAHARDFLDSFTDKYDTADWNQGGVMFIMENPSKDYGIYEDTTIIKSGVTYTKRPSKDWYWIHTSKDAKGYPQNFKGGSYGEFVASAIVTFHLANAYMTNLIKCGMNGPADSFKGIDSYKSECIDKCCKEYLDKEIEIIKPKVIFTFGTKVYDYVSEHVGETIKVVGLPHPAGQRRGFKDEYYNVLYFCMIAKWLYKEGVIDYKFYKELMCKTFPEQPLAGNSIE